MASRAASVVFPDPDGPSTQTSLVAPHREARARLTTSSIGSTVTAPFYQPGCGGRRPITD